MTKDGLRVRIESLIARLADGGRDDAARDDLIEDVLGWQRDHVAPYRRLAAQRQGDRMPAMPTDVFRFARVASHGPEDDLRVFRTSATTNARRGVHHLESLSLYDLAARTAARHALFPDDGPLRLLILAPAEAEATDSSLSYMLARFAEWFGSEEAAYAWGADALQPVALGTALDVACDTGVPVALLGTSFAFAHAERQLGAQRWSLPERSRIMQTGGFKGRSRTVDPDTMLDWLTTRFGLDPRFIIQEYGMTELCSQMYERTLRDALVGEAPTPRRLWVPGWVRATPVDPETLAPVADGELGILRIDDLANLDSVCAIQTSDLARRVQDGIVLFGRAPDAVARGCSIAVDAALGS